MATMRFWVSIVPWLLVASCLAQAPFPDRTSRLDARQLYVAERTVPLYQQHQPVTDLNARTVVEAEPAVDGQWLRVQYEGRYYEADASAFWPEKSLTEEMARYEGEVRERYRTTVAEYDQLRARIRQLECEADHYETPEGNLRVVFPPPAPWPNTAAVAPSSQVVVVVKARGPGQVALCRREARKLTRQLQKLEQQLADLEREGLRIADIRSSTERRFADYRLARQSP
jgi:hypothetical protein